MSISTKQSAGETSKPKYFSGHLIEQTTDHIRRPKNRPVSGIAKLVAAGLLLCGAFGAIQPSRVSAVTEDYRDRSVAQITVPRGVKKSLTRAETRARKRGFGLVLRSEFLGTDSRPFAVRLEDLPTYWRRDGVGVARGHNQSDVPLMYEIHNPYAKRVYLPYNLLALVGVWFPLCHVDEFNQVSHVEMLTPMEGTAGFAGLYKTSILRTMTRSAETQLGPRDRLYECVALKPNDKESTQYIRQNFNKICTAGIGQGVLPFCPEPGQPELKSKSLRARIADTGQDAYVFIKGQRTVQKLTYLADQFYKMFEIDFAAKVRQLNGRNWFTPLEVAKGARGTVPVELVDPLQAVLGDELYRFVSGLQRLLPPDNLQKMKIKVPECTNAEPVKVSIRYMDLVESVELVETKGTECYRIHRK